MSRSQHPVATTNKALSIYAADVLAKIYLQMAEVSNINNSGLDTRSNNYLQSPKNDPNKYIGRNELVLECDKNKEKIGVDELPKTSTGNFFSKDTERVRFQTSPLEGEDILLEQDVLVAATLVSDAKAGVHSEFETNERSVRLYIIYHHRGLRYLLFLFIFLNHLLAVFEKPSVVGFELPYWATMCMEFSCLVYYGIRLLHAGSFTPTYRFWCDKKNIVILLVICLTLADMTCYLGLIHSGHEHFAYRWSRPLRPMFFVNFSESKQVRRAFRNIRRTLPDILNVLILFFLSIALFSLMGQKLFMKRSLKYPDGSPYFTSYLDIFFDLYVLVTTSNNPDIMMPAYDENHWYSVFFIIYLIICLYIFMNIFLAVVYNNYRKHLKNEVRKVVYLKRQNLARAFDLLKVTIGNDSFLTFKRFSTLMKMIPPVRSPTVVNILWFALDRDGNSRIDKADFLQLADLLNVAMSEIKDRKTLLDSYFPKFFNSKPSTVFRSIIAHKYFKHIFDILIVLNAFLIAFDIFDAEWIFLSLFTFEIICKLYTFGWKQFFRKFWNSFDFVIIGAAIIGTTVETVLGDSAVVKARTLDVLLVLRVLRLIKIVGSIQRFQVIVMTIMSLGPSILTYGGVLFVVYYTYAIIGMEIFQNKILYHGYGPHLRESFRFCGSSKLNATIFYLSHYCSNNFNDIFSSMVLLFELMVVNQWHVLASGFVAVTSKAARIYFFFFHLACVIIVLNIFTAFVLEAFILEYSFSKSKVETAIEKKIGEMGLRLGKKPKATKNGLTELVNEMELNVGVNNDQFDSSRRKSSIPDMSEQTDVRFHITKKKDVESLLQRMFENELGIEELGPSDVDNPTNEELSMNQI